MRNLRAGILRQDHAHFARHRRNAEAGRHRRLHRCRARARPGLCPQARRQCRRPADLAAGRRRAGAGNRRHAGALRRGRRRGGRLGGGADAALELEGEMGEPQPGLQARLMSQALRKLTSTSSAPIAPGDFHQPDPHEDRRDVRQPETTSGGNALKFYASVRLDIRRIGSPSRTNDEVIGNETRVKVVKNKMAPPFTRRPSSTSSTARAFPSCGRNHRSRRQGTVSWRSPAPGTPMTGQRIGQGRDNSRDFLKDHPELAAEIEAAVRRVGRADRRGDPGRPP